MADIADIARARGVETRRKIFVWFQENPCHTKQDAAEALGVTPHTIGHHAKAIREGWRPEAEADHG